MGICDQWSVMLCPIAKGYDSLREQDGIFPPGSIFDYSMYNVLDIVLLHIIDCSVV